MFLEVQASVDVKASSACATRLSTRRRFFVVQRFLGWCRVPRRISQVISFPGLVPSGFRRVANRVGHGASKICFVSRNIVQKFRPSYGVPSNFLPVPSSWGQNVCRTGQVPSREGHVPHHVLHVPYLLGHVPKGIFPVPNHLDYVPNKMGHVPDGNFLVPNQIFSVPDGSFFVPCRMGQRKNAPNQCIHLKKQSRTHSTGEQHDESYPPTLG